MVIGAGAMLIGGAGSTIQWRIATEYPRTAMPGEGVATFAAELAAATDGLVTADARFDAPDGLRSADMPRAVADGRLEAGDSFAATLAPLDPVFGLSGLPFLTGSAADAARLLQVARPAYAAALERLGLRLLYATPWPPSGLWSRAPVPDAAALRGLRVRTYDAASAAVFAAAGAEPRAISFADAQPLLRSGALDAVLSSGDGGAGARLWETLPHFTTLDYAFPLSLAFCSAKAVAALPDPGLVRLAGERTEARQFALLATRDAANAARMRDNGVSVTSAPALRAALTAAAAPVIAQWDERVGPAGKQALALYRAGG